MVSISYSMLMEKHGYWKSMEGISKSMKFRPSMTANTNEDSSLKTGLIDDVMTLINVEGLYILMYAG